MVGGGGWHGSYLTADLTASSSFHDAKGLAASLPSPPPVDGARIYLLIEGNLTHLTIIDSFDTKTPQGR